MNANYRNFALWVIIFLLVLALVTLFQSPGQKAPTSEISFSQLLSEVDQGHVREVTIAACLPRHANIALLYGVSVVVPTLCVVTEFRTKLVAMHF